MRTAIEVFCFEGDAPEGCSSRLFGGEAEKQTGYGFQPVDDRLTPQAVYERVVADLKKSPDINDNRVAAQLQLQREIGLRKEVAFKFNPSACLLSDGRVLVHKGTKGGRERVILEVSERAKQERDYAKHIVDGTNTMPNDKTIRCHSGILDS